MQIFKLSLQLGIDIPYVILIFDLSKTLKLGLLAGVGNSTDRTGKTLHLTSEISKIAFAKSYQLTTHSFE